MESEQRPADSSDGGGDQEVVHEFGLVDIRDPCIIGLDLLPEWTAITLGSESLVLQSGHGKDRVRKPKPSPGYTCPAALRLPPLLIRDGRVPP